MSLGPGTGPKIALVAGEASGDILGASLIDALARRHPGAEFVGVAGPSMIAAGCRAWWPSETLAVMGLAEVVRHLPRLLKLRRSLLRRLQEESVDLLIGIDAPDFNLGLEVRARRAGIPTVHYVSPSIWAWREGRVKLIERACDHVLCLLPFEPDLYERHGVAASFVGHPTADAIAFETPRQPAREALDLTAAESVVALLPGSRSGEVSRLGPAFIDAAIHLAELDPSRVFAVPLVAGSASRIFERMLAERSISADIRVYDGQSRTVMAAADAVICASGTAALEAALIKRPTVVAYAVAPLTAWTVRKLNLIRLEYYSLPNLLASKPIFPEFIQDQVNGARMAAALTQLMRPDARAGWYDACVELHQTLARDASERAADAVDGVLAATRV